MIDKKANDTATENADAQVGSEDKTVVTQEQAVIRMKITATLNSRNAFLRQFIIPRIQSSPS